MFSEYHVQTVGFVEGATQGFELFVAVALAMLVFEFVYAVFLFFELATV